MTKSSINHRAAIVRSMNTLVLSLNNEEPLFSSWLYIVPDEATEDDFVQIAEDEDLFIDVVDTFKDIMNGYLKDGFCIDNKLY